jgi:hypothetical protein
MLACSCCHGASLSLLQWTGSVVLQRSSWISVIRARVPRGPVPHPTRCYPPPLPQAHICTQPCHCPASRLPALTRCPTLASPPQEVGVKLGPKGQVLVDEYSATSVPSIYAVGDVTDRIQLTPVALMEGMAVAKTLVLGEPTKPDYWAVPSAVFSYPEMATVVSGRGQGRAVQGLVQAGGLAAYVCAALSAYRLPGIAMSCVTVVLRQQGITSQSQRSTYLWCDTTTHCRSRPDKPPPPPHPTLPPCRATRRSRRWSSTATWTCTAPASGP